MAYRELDLRTANPVGAAIQSYKSVNDIFTSAEDRRLAKEDRSRLIERQAISDQQAKTNFDNALVDRDTKIARDTVVQGQQDADRLTSNTTAAAVEARAASTYTQQLKNLQENYKLMVQQRTQGKKTFDRSQDNLDDEQDAKIVAAYDLKRLQRGSKFLTETEHATMLSELSERGQAFFASQHKTEDAGKARASLKTLKSLTQGFANKTPGTKQKAIDFFNTDFHEQIQAGGVQEGWTETRKEVTDFRPTPEGTFVPIITVFGKNPRGKIDSYSAPATIGQDANPDATVNQFSLEGVAGVLNNRANFAGGLDVFMASRGDKTEINRLKKKAITKDKNKVMLGVQQKISEMGPQIEGKSLVESLNILMPEVTKDIGGEVSYAEAAKLVGDVLGYKQKDVTNALNISKNNVAAAKNLLEANKNNQLKDGQRTEIYNSLAAKLDLMGAASTAQGAEIRMPMDGGSRVIKDWKSAISVLKDDPKYAPVITKFYEMARLAERDWDGSNVMATTDRALAAYTAYHGTLRTEGNNPSNPVDVKAFRDFLDKITPEEAQIARKDAGQAMSDAVDKLNGKKETETSAKPTPALVRGNIQQNALTQ